MLSDRQQQILHESVKIIDSKGIQGFTIKNLSKEVGISEPGIYRHFDSKYDILSAILDSFKNKILENQEVFLRSTKDPFVKLRIFFTRIFEILTNNPALVSVIFAEEIYQNEKQLSDRVNEIQKLNETLVVSILTELRQTNRLPQHINIDAFILMFFGSIRLLAKKWKTSGYSFNLKEKGDELFSSLVGSIK